MTKRLLAALLALALTLSLAAGCATAPTQEADGRLRVVCTLFPPYDFTRQIAGDAVDVTLLLSPGEECHAFEPTPKDILDIQNCDLFLYGGGESEAWVEDILASVGGDVHALALMDCVKTVTEETLPGMQAAGEADGAQDEHVWTSPRNAARICEALCGELCALDTANAAVYTAACAAYTAQLDALDAAFREAVDAGARRELVFADRFPFRYFADDYGLTCRAAFPGCENNAEASAATVASLIDWVREEKIPVVLYIEFSNQKLADTLCEAAGAQKRLFHSCHNVTAAEFSGGATYLSLMTDNLTVLKEALA